MEANCLDGAPSVPSNMTATPQVYSSSDKMTAFCNRSRFGMTCGPLTASRGEELCRSFRAAFPVRIFLSQEKEQELTGSILASGQKWPASLVKYDHDTCSWKTAQLSLFVDSDEFSETWPRWGTMRNGECWARSIPAHLTSGTESGLLPTPLATIATHGGPNQRDSSGRPGLQMAARMWPTPQAHKTTESGKIVNADGTPWDGVSKPHSATTGRPITTALADAVKMRKGCSAKSGDGLATFVAKYPTPCAQDAKNSTLPVSQRDSDSIPGFLLSSGEQPGGQLNPTWVEWFMNWPLGWTSLDPLPKETFQDWQQRTHDGAWWDCDPSVTPHRDGEIVGRVTVGVKARVDRLKAIGNGQVPAVVRMAWQTLTMRNR